MSQPLVPVVNQANVVISKADAPAFLTGIAALTPLPEGKTTAQLTRYTFTVSPDGTIKISVNFK